MERLSVRERGVRQESPRLGTQVSAAGVQGSQGMTVNVRAQSVDSTMVVSPVDSLRSRGILNQKDLYNIVRKSRNQTGRSDLSRLASGEQEDADLLIRKGFSAGWQWREGERLLNLKDLLAMVQPSHKRVFENGPILKPIFLSRIGPDLLSFPARTWQNMVRIDVFRHAVL